MSALLALFVGVMGAGLAVQPLLNARVAGAIGHPVHAAMLSVLISTLSMIAVALAFRLPWPDLRAVAALPVWTLAGGVIGAFVVLSALLAAPRLGSATTVALFITGQLVAALILDHHGWLGLPEHAFDLKRALGVGCLVAGVVLIRWA